MRPSTNSQDRQSRVSAAEQANERFGRYISEIVGEHDHSTVRGAGEHLPRLTRLEESSVGGQQVAQLAEHARPGVGVGAGDEYVVRACAKRCLSRCRPTLALPALGLLCVSVMHQSQPRLSPRGCHGRSGGDAQGRSRSR
jgi:hypothetical protein